MIKVADRIRHKYLHNCRFYFMSEWECDFIKGTMGKRLMPKQIEKLREIYTKQRAKVKNEYSFPR